MKRTRLLSVILILAMAAALLLGTACGTSSAGEDVVVGPMGPQGPQGEQGPQGTQGPAGPNMIVAMGMVNADASLGQAYNVDSVTWDAANSRYVIGLADVTYAHNSYVTLVTAVDSNYTATYGAENGNLIVFLRNTSGDRQKDNFSFVVLEAP
jgi:predicted small secreted protein